MPQLLLLLLLPLLVLLLPLLLLLEVHRNGGDLLPHCLHFMKCALVLSKRTGTIVTSLSVLTLNKEGPEGKLCGFKYVCVALNTFFFLRTTDSLCIESENSRDDKRNHLVTE